MMQYDHIYAAICIMIKLKVMFWKLYTRIYFNVGTFNNRIKSAGGVIEAVNNTSNIIEEPRKAVNNTSHSIG